MKKLSFLLLGVFIYASVISQTVTVRFEGAASSNANNPRDYAIDLDGKWYYSSNANAAGASGARQLVINDLALGSHKISVYEVKDNSVAANAGTNELLYSNTFQLRTGYDMVIAVRRNGDVTYTEKKMKQDGTSKSSASPMTDTEFNKLLQSVKVKWSQSSRYTAIKTAFATKANNFTTHQVGELLLLITSETRRLELAKLSYPKVTDQHNFADVSDLFTTQANKNNIEQFIQSKNPDLVPGSVNTSRKPVATQQFNQLLRKTRNQYQQPGKYAVLRDAFSVTTDYYTTSQVRQLLVLITTESDRLALAKLSYPQISDEQNFASLSNLFTTQAARDDFNSYVRSGGSLTSTGQYASRIAMSDIDFSRLHTKARLHFRQSSVISDVKEAFTNKSNYFTVNQIRSLLALISVEADKLALAKLAYHRAADPGNFTQLFDIFTSQTSVNELDNYIKTNPS